MFSWLTSPVRPIPDLTVIIPAWNAADYFDIFLEYYIRVVRIPVTVFVDSKTTDRTLAIARRYVAEVVEVPNPDTMVEGIIETISRACRTKWILRIDDDELPSITMLEHVRQVIVQDRLDACGFPRYECAITPDGNLIQHRRFDAVRHKQYRLYQRDRVKYTVEGHTPGFLLNDIRAEIAPVSAALVHLDWAVHSFQRRKEKFWRYEARKAGHGSCVPGLILYEESPDYRTRFEHLHIAELRAPVRRLSRRFSSFCIDSYPS